MIFDDGLKEGLEQGIKQGQKLGVEYKLIEQSCVKLRKGKKPEEIADELEEEGQLITDICKTAEPFAPDYDCKGVYQAWREQRKDIKQSS